MWGIKIGVFEAAESIPVVSFTPKFLTYEDYTLFQFFAIMENSKISNSI